MAKLEKVSKMIEGEPSGTYITSYGNFEKNFFTL
jgi:hypothetical protein